MHQSWTDYYRYVGMAAGIPKTLPALGIGVALSVSGELIRRCPDLPQQTIRWVSASSCRRHLSLACSQFVAYFPMQMVTRPELRLHTAPLLRYPLRH